MSGVDAARCRPAGLAEVDFAAFGEVEVKPLSRIQGLTAGFLSRNWHEPFRTSRTTTTPTSRRSTRCARRWSPSRARWPSSPRRWCRRCRRSRSSTPRSMPRGSNLVLKKYFHIGIAIDTPRGLVVGVVRDCDRKGVAEHRRRHRRAVGQGARPRAADGRDGRRLHVDQLAGRHRRHRPSRRSSTRRRSRSSASRKAQWKPRRGADDAHRMAADDAAVAELRPPRDQRRRRGALPAPPGRGACPPGGTAADPQGHPMSHPQFPRSRPFRRTCPPRWCTTSTSTTSRSPTATITRR